MERTTSRQAGSTRSASGYVAFLSYSHALDGRLGAAVQTGLERFAKPWYRIRALRVFRDKLSLSASPGLWSSIERGLEASEWLLLMASPEAARSPWVRKEVGWWLQHRGADRLLIVLTGGQLAWDPAQDDFDWPRTDALPEEVLRGAFAEEPFWVDLRWAHNEEQLDQSNPRFRECVAELAAPLHGVSKDELVGEHVRQHRRTMRLARAAVAGLTMLAVATTAASAIALVQRNTAREQARIALARQAAATAVASTGTRLDLAQLLSVAAYHLDRTPQATAALFRAVGESPHLVRYLQAGAPVSALASSMDGSVIAAGTDDGRVLTWDLRTGRHSETHLANRRIHAISLDVRGDRIAATDGVHAQVWQRAGNSPPVVLAAAARRPADLVALSPLGTAVAVLYQEDADSATSKPGLLALYSSASGAVRATATGQVALDFVDFSSESTVTTGSFDGRHSAWTLSGHRLAPAWNMTLSPAPFNNYLSAHAQGGTYYGYVKDGNVTSCHLPWTDGPCSGGGVPTAAMEAMAISPDGRRAAVAAAGTIYLTGMTAEARSDTGSVLALTGNSQVDHLIYLGATRRLASSSGAAVAVWDPAQVSRLARPTGIRVPYQSFAAPVPTFAVTPDGNRIAIFDDFNEQSDRIYDLRTGRLLATLEGMFQTSFAEWSEDGALLVGVGSGGGGRVWDLRGSPPSLVATWPADDRASQEEAWICALRVLAGQRRLMLVDTRGSVVVRDLTNGRVVSQRQALESPRGGKVTVDAADISADGQRIAVLRGNVVEVIGADGRRRASTSIADTPEPGPTRQSTREVTFQPDGTVIVRGTDGAVSFWDPRNGRVERRFAGSGRKWQPTAIAPGEQLLVTLQDDGVAVVTDLTSGERIGTLALPAADRSIGGGIGVISRLAFVPGGATLVSVTAGGTVLRWDLSRAGWLRTACATVGRDLTGDEWRRYIGGGAPVQRPCSTLDTDPH